MEEYNEKNIKRIMRGDILDSPLIDEKINQTYDAIRDLSSVVSYEERKRTGLAGLRKAIVALVVYSKHQKSQFEGSIDAQNAESRKVRIIEEDMVNMCGGTFTLIDVQVLDSCEGLDGNAMCENKIAYEKIFDEQGRVNSYKRETVTYGDGISQPQRSVVERNVINPKIVYVTAQYENVNPFSNGRIEIPDLTFYEESNEGTSLYIRDYVRPDYVRDAMTDNAPFYFEETLGGKEFYFTEIQKGITTVHFAYLVDDDMLDKMALNLTPWVDSNYAPVLVDISVDE